MLHKPSWFRLSTLASVYSDGDLHLLASCLACCSSFPSLMRPWENAVYNSTYLPRSLRSGGCPGGLNSQDLAQLAVQAEGLVSQGTPLGPVQHEVKNYEWSGILSYLQANQLACHSLIDNGKSPGSRGKNLLTLGTPSNMSFVSASVPLTLPSTPRR